MDRDKILDKAREVFQIEIEGLQKVKTNLDESFISAVEMILACQGKVVVSGMGKSGIIAHKIAATMSSIGTLAVFLHPAEALHGDLGIVASDDVMLIIAKSGESDEITGMLPALSKIGAKIIAITHNLNSTLARHAHVVLDAGIEKEACKMNLAPTTSTTAALVMGDALATVLSIIKDFQEKDYALFHPGGRLGKRLILQVSDFMYKLDDIAVVEPEVLFKEVVFAMSEKNHGACLILDGNGGLAGLIADGDIKRIIKGYDDLSEVTAGMVMTVNPKVLDLDKSAYDALLLMQKTYDITVIPVMKEDKPVGLLRLHDLLTAGL